MPTLPAALRLEDVPVVLRIFDADPALLRGEKAQVSQHLTACIGFEQAARVKQFPDAATVVRVMQDILPQAVKAKTPAFACIEEAQEVHFLERR